LAVEVKTDWPVSVSAWAPGDSALGRGARQPLALHLIYESPHLKLPAERHALAHDDKDVCDYVKRANSSRPGQFYERQRQLNGHPKHTDWNKVPVEQLEEVLNAKWSSARN